MSTLTNRVQAWRDAGEIAELGGRRLYIHTRAGAGPPILFLHGYPSSSYDWRGVLDALPGRQTVCFDFVGFGLSEKPRAHAYSLYEQADLAQAVWRRELGEPVLLVGHDMGTSVATELLARDLDGTLDMQIAAVLLFNGSMVLERAHPTISQKVLRSRLGPLLSRMSNERVFRAQFARIFSPAHPLSVDEAADQWSLLAHDRGHRILHELISYMDERVRHSARWHGALRDWPGRLELAWGLRDPVATVAVLDAVLELRPGAPVTRLPDLGHYPQLERPQAIAEAIERLARA